MNLPRIALVFTLAPLLVLLERTAYYASRSVLFLHLQQLGLPPAGGASLFTISSLVVLLTTLLGGAVAIGVGPAWPLAVGCALAAVGHVLLSVSDGEAMVWVAMLTMAAGQGLFRPGVYALAAVELFHPNEQLRNAAYIALYATTNVAGLLAPNLAGGIAVRADVPFALGAAAAVMGASALLAAVLAGLWWMFRDRAPSERSLPDPGKLAIGALGLIALGVVFNLMLQFSSEAQYTLLRSVSTSTLGMVHGANPVTVIVVAAVLLAASVVFHFARLRPPALLFVAFGACIAASASLPLLLLPLSTGAALATSLVTAIAEVLFVPFALSRAAGDMPPRFVPIVVAVWMAAGTGAGLVASTVSRALPGSEKLLAALFSGLGFLLGAALLFAAVPLARKLYAPPEPAP